MARSPGEAEQDRAGAASGASTDETLPAAMPQPGPSAGGPSPFRPVDAAWYALGGEIARGGMGRVISAHDLHLRRTVAIKELLADDPDTAARFEREALITAGLQHPAIVNIHEAGRWPSGKPFYAMKLVSGRPLERVAADAQTLEERLALLPKVTAVVEALAYAHSRRVIHRDLKPANVIVGEFGETVVIDWGLAKNLAGDVAGGSAAGAREGSEPAPAPANRPYAALARRTARGSDSGETIGGAVMGTPMYMPPEQAAGRPVDERADVYSLGAMLYHVLAGTPPYEGRSGDEILGKVLAGPPLPLEQREAALPADLLAIVRKAMARTPAERYPTAGEMLDDLRRFQTGQLVASYRYTRRELAARWVRRNRAAVAVAGFALVVGATAGLASIRRIVRSEHEARDLAASLAREKRDTERQYLALLEEEGRENLLAGRRVRAAAALERAYSGGDRSPSIRFLLARALAGVDSLQRTLVEGGGAVLAIGVSPDGSRLCSGGQDGSAALWDVASGDRIATLAGHSGPVYSCEFSRDGRLLVTAGGDRTARLWDGRTGAAKATLTGHTGAVIHAEISADGASVVTAGWDGTARVWDAATGRSKAIWRGRGHVIAARFLPDGRDVVVGDLFDALGGLQPGQTVVETGGGGESSDAGSSAVTIWDPTGAAPATTIGLSGRPLFSLAVSPDGKQLATVDDTDTCDLWDVATGRLLREMDGGTIVVQYGRYQSGPVVAFVEHDQPVDFTRPAVAFSPDGTRLVTHDGSSVARLWDARNGAALASLTDHAEGITSVGFAADGAAIVTSSADGTAKLWDGENGSLQATLASGAPAAEDAVVTGARVIVARADGIVDLWSRRDAEDLRAVVDETGESFAFSPDGSRLAIETDAGVALLDRAAGWTRSPVLLATGCPLWDVRFDRDGARVLGTCGSEARLWDARTGAPVRSWPDALRAWLSPDGSLLATASAAGVRTWDVASGAAVATIDHPFARVASVADAQGFVAWSPDGRRLLIGGDTGAGFWEARGGALEAPLGGSGAVRWVGYAPDGSRVLLERVDPGAAELWDPAARRLVAVLPGQDAATGRFSPDGRWIVTYAGHQATVWSSATGERVATLPHEQAVEGAAFSPGGELVVTTTDLGPVSLWDPSTGTPLDRLAWRSAHESRPTFSPDGAYLATRGADGRFELWDVHAEGRPDGAIEQVVGRFAALHGGR